MTQVSMRLSHRALCVITDALAAKISSDEKVLADLDDEDAKADLIGDLSFLDILLAEFREALRNWNVSG